ncbi:MAG: HDOD domain-containing protein [Armatimonadetes bacterium]|nr:HDOD domain-containing protein [Armatimonadota bacterium]
MDIRSPERQRAVIARLQSIDQLDPAWCGFTELIRLTKDPNVPFREIESRIGQSPGFGSHVVSLASSVAYAGGNVKNIRQAIAVLGLNGVRSILASLALRNLTMRQAPGGRFDGGTFMRRCLALAFVHKTLAERQMMTDPECAYLAGLVQEIGYLALSQCIPDVLDETITIAQRQSGEPLISVERRHLGFDHAWVGAVLAEKWGFDPIVLSAIRFHHDPSDAPSDHKPVVDLGHVASWICHEFAIPPLPGAQGHMVDPYSLMRVGLNARDLEHLRNALPAHIHSVLDSFLSAA